MSTKKKISDIDKAIEEMQQRRDECFKHIGKAMYESCPELGDMSVADMRKAGRYLHKLLTKKAPSQGAVPARNGAPVASDSGSTSAVFCQVVIGQCGVSFPSEKAVGFSPVRNWPVIARVLLFHCIRA